MNSFKIIVDYPHPPAKVWRALCDPVLIPVWTSSGQGAKAVGFGTKVGTNFQYVAKPMPGWNGIVDCEVVACVDHSLLKYTWQSGDKHEAPQMVTCHLEARDGGTHFTWEHAGFQGIGGTVMAKLLRSVRKKMLTTAMPILLRDLDTDGHPLPGSDLAARLAESR